MGRKVKANYKLQITNYKLQFTNNKYVEGADFWGFGWVFNGI